MSTRARNNLTGFSIVELLVVVTVIVLLLALLTPAIDRAMSQAEQVRCAAVQHQMGLANAMYASESTQWFVLIKEAIPVVTAANGQVVGNPWPANVRFKSLLGVSDVRTNSGLWWPRSYACPTAPPQRAAAGNIWATLAFNWSGAAATFSDQIAVKRSRVAYPSDSVQMVDSNDWHTIGHMPAGQGPRAKYDAEWDVYGDPATSVRTAVVTYRHNQGANIQHFDGSTRYYRKEQAWKFDPDPVKEAALNQRMWRVYP